MPTFSCVNCSTFNTAGLSSFPSQFWAFHCALHMNRPRDHCQCRERSVGVVNFKTGTTTSLHKSYSQQQRMRRHAYPASMWPSESQISDSWHRHRHQHIPECSSDLYIHRWNYHMHQFDYIFITLWQACHTSVWPLTHLKNSTSNFTKYCAQVTCGRCSVLLSRQCNTLSSSGFADDITHEQWEDSITA